MHSYVNDAVGGSLPGGLPAPGPATVAGLNTVASETSMSGSLTPSPESSVQLTLPSLTRVAYSPETPV